MFEHVLVGVDAVREDATPSLWPDSMSERLRPGY
jgi:hypothetical protein